MDDDIDFLSGKDEQFCDWCFKIAGLYNRRAVLISEGKFELGMNLDPAIKQIISDFKGWMLKQ